MLRISSCARTGTYLVSIPRIWHIGQKKKKKCLEAEQRADCTNQINLSFALKYVWEETKQINKNIQLKW